MKEISDRLLAWYDVHKRKMPWRDIGDPYATWVSETMLQQTRVDTVRDYFPRFMQAFPDVQALAAAPLQAVYKQWEGLGYYRRAANLHKGAGEVVERFNGILPQTVPELLTISGIGEYTAGAIASIAYQQPVPAVDGNVIRVTARLTGQQQNVGIPAVHKQLAADAALLVPADRPGDFNQAMMDLGAGICVPGTPDCDHCPLATCCQACLLELTEAIPCMPQKKPPRPVDYDVLLLFTADRRVVMRCRTETMLQGLWVFPMIEKHHSREELEAAAFHRLGLQVKELQDRGEARHVFSHQVWQMRLWTGELCDIGKQPDWKVFSAAQLQALPMPTAMKAARTIVLQKWME